MNTMLVEVETYDCGGVWVHVLECDKCGRTCEHVNGDYDYCPHCGEPNYGTVCSWNRKEFTVVIAAIEEKER